VLTYKSIFIKR